MRAPDLDRLCDLLRDLAVYMLATRPDCAWVMLEIYADPRRDPRLPQRVLAASDVLQADGYRHDEVMRREAEAIIAREMSWSFVDGESAGGMPLAGPFFARREAVSAHELLTAQRRFMTR